MTDSRDEPGTDADAVDPDGPGGPEGPEESLGLERGTVELREHDPRWAAAFEREADRLRDALGERAIAVAHVGSTAVEGLPAKPILDLAVGVESMRVAHDCVPRLEAMGYEHRPDAPGERVLLAKGPRDLRTHYTSLVVHGGRKWRAYLAFRDALREDPALREEYAGLKRRLAAAHPDERATYTAEKAAFVERVTERVLDGG